MALWLCDVVALHMWCRGSMALWLVALDLLSFSEIKPPPHAQSFSQEPINFDRCIITDKINGFNISVHVYAVEFALRLHSFCEWQNGILVRILFLMFITI